MCFNLRGTYVSSLVFHEVHNKWCKITTYVEKRQRYQLASQVPVIIFDYHKRNKPRNARSTLSSSNCSWPTQRGNPKKPFCQQSLLSKKVEIVSINNLICIRIQPSTSHKRDEIFIHLICHIWKSLIQTYPDWYCGQSWETSCPHRQIRCWCASTT